MIVKMVVEMLLLLCLRSSKTSDSDSTCERLEKGRCWVGVVVRLGQEATGGHTELASETLLEVTDHVSGST